MSRTYVYGGHSYVAVTPVGHFNILRQVDGLDISHLGELWRPKYFTWDGIAADHEPFMEKFKPLNFHASVSTFLEGRASAVAAKKFGWKRAAVMVPNYAYGQDVTKAFVNIESK